MNNDKKPKKRGRKPKIGFGQEPKTEVRGVKKVRMKKSMLILPIGTRLILMKLSRFCTLRIKSPRKYLFKTQKFHRAQKRSQSEMFRYQNRSEKSTSRSKTLILVVKKISLFKIIEKVACIFRTTKTF